MPTTTPSQPTLSILHPSSAATVAFNQPITVTGTATDQEFPESISIDSVTVQLDGGPIIQAALKIVPRQKLVTVDYTATITITGGSDPHTLTVVATNERSQTTTRSITVFTGPIFSIDRPSIVLDLLPVLPLDPTAPYIATLVSNIQQQLLPVSAALAGIGKQLIGPNLLFLPSNGLLPAIRLGFWIEEPSFPVVAAVPPGNPLPTLLPLAAADGFALAPLLPFARLTGLLNFKVSVPVTTLQHLVDAIAPSVKDEASKHDVSFNSLTVTTGSPNTVETHFSGSLPLDIPVDLTITETIGLTASNATPPSVPTILNTTHSGSVGGILDWLLSTFVPFLNLALLTATGFADSAAGTAAGQISGTVGPLIANLPSRIPFKNTAAPFGANFTFPTAVFDWASFSADSSGLQGIGSVSIEDRTQSDVGINLQGSGFVEGIQADLDGGAGQGYFLALANLDPDAGKLNWLVTGSGTTQAPIDLSPITESGEIDVDFPLSEKVAPGKYPFTLTVTAVETCGTDRTKVLTASTSLPVTVQVDKNPIIIKKR